MEALIVDSKCLDTRYFAQSKPELKRGLIGKQTFLEIVPSVKEIRIICVAV